MGSFLAKNKGQFCSEWAVFQPNIRVSSVLCGQFSGQKQESVVLCVDDVWCGDMDCAWCRVMDWAWCRDTDCVWCLLAVLPSPEPADGGAAVGTGGQPVGDGLHQDRPLLWRRRQSPFSHFLSFNTHLYCQTYT